MAKLCAATAILLGVCSLGVSGKDAEPCCRTCEAGKEKFYSVPDPTEKNPQCGECCLNPHLYRFWKLFEPKLLKGDCASHGFTKYASTETDGVYPLEVTNDRYVKPDTPLESLKPRFCPDSLHAVYADMHDGDKKEVIISGSSLTIKPSGNNQTWIVQTHVDAKTCSANIDFNVPGKPGPPPVNLTASLWYSVSTASKKTEFEFTDPSGTLAAKTFPLNRWVELSNKPEQHGKKSWSCPSLKAVYADMHDGDKKEIVISGSSLTITPYGNNQTWVIKSKLDSETCSAKVNFDVPGKPSPPPVALSGRLLYTFSATEKKTEFEFTDPSGTLASAEFPLNHWVQIKKEEDVLI